MTKSIYFSLIFLSSLFIFSCSDDDSSGPPVTLPSTGYIKGSVNLYDEGTTQVDNSGMTVSTSGTLIQSQTNDTGSFDLEDVPYGKIVLSYEKSGYGTYKYFIDDHNSDLNITVNPSLGKISQTRGVTNSVEVDGDVVKISSVTAGTNTSKRYLRYFFSTKDDVSSSNYEAFSPTFESDANSNPVNHEITKTELNNYGFSSGTTVYAKVYGDSFWSNNYDDPDLNITVFPNLNENSAESVMFVVP